MEESLVWQALLAVTTATFMRPTFRLFCQIASGWILCPVRRTITGMMPTADPDRKRPHDAFHYFFRDAAWKTDELWRSQTLPLIAALCPGQGPLTLLVDDTIVHKTGRRVENADVFRDPIRSTVHKIVYAFGLNVVLLCVCIRLPYVRQPLALPVNLRLYTKGGPSHLALAATMVQILAQWLPDRHFTLIGDGAYASLAKAGLPRTHVTSRLRRDAALYNLPLPRQPGQRGRARKKGSRLPTPLEIAAAAASHQWRLASITLRDRTVQRLILTRVVLWYDVTADLPIRLVIVRDPKGHEHDDFFFTTDTDADPATVASDYNNRWPIEVTFRDAKQVLTLQHPQSWRRCGPSRTVTVGFWLHSAVWLWFIRACGDKPVWPDRPWYTRKRSPSFADALTALRAALWRERLSATTAAVPEFAKIAETVVAALARAG